MAKRTQADLQKKIEEYYINQEPISMRQCKLALNEFGLLSQVDGAIANMTEPDKTKAQIEWQYASVVDRSSKWINDLGTQLGLTNQDINNLFKLAKTL